MGGRVGSFIKKGARDIYRVGKKIYKPIRKGAKFLDQFSGEIAKYSPKAAAVISGISHFDPEKFQSSGWSSIKEAYQNKAGAALRGASSKFSQFRAHPATQGFMSSPIGKRAVRGVKTRARDIMSALDVSTQKQRQMVQKMASVSRGIHKSANPPNIRGNPYRKWATHNPVTQNIGRASFGRKI